MIRLLALITALIFLSGCALSTIKPYKRAQTPQGTPVSTTKTITKPVSRPVRKAERAPASATAAAEPEESKEEVIDVIEEDEDIK